MRVSIIIINWNSWKDTLKCLESVYKINYPDYNVILLDNASMDESIEKIRDYCKGKIKVESPFFEYNPNNKPIEIIEYTNKEIEAKKSIKEADKKSILIKNDKNYGFAEGNNIGIRYALNSLNSDYILLLNNDTVVDNDFLDKLVKTAENDEQIGIVGPAVYCYDKPDKISVFGGYIKFNTGRNVYPGLNKSEIPVSLEENEIDYISGCSLLIKRKTLEDIGVLNTNYFLYYEDTELSLRAKRRGYKVSCVPAAKIWHKISPSSVSSTGIYYLTRNRFWLIKTYASNSQYYLFIIFFFIFYFWFHTFRHLIYYRDFKRLISFYNGIKDGITTDA